jgi:endonuclease VIII
MLRPYLSHRTVIDAMPEGHTIHRIARDHGALLAERTVRVSSPQGRFSADAARVDGATLERIQPYGKHLFYEWSTGEVGHVHLGLFGKFRVQHTDVPPEPVGQVRMRLVAETDDAHHGFVTVDLSGPTACTIDPPSVRAGILARLGPDPIRRGSKPDAMFARVERSSRGIGDLLMDQSVVAGVGNVYRAEALFVTGIHPLRRGRDLDRVELDALWSTVQGMLRQGVKDGRIVTVRRDELGIAPTARITRREATYAYGRERCRRCGDEIRRITIANRTCYYCPTDQPGP